MLKWWFGIGSLVWLSGGCAEEADLVTGVYAGCLNAVELNSLVKLEDEETWLALNLFRDEEGKLEGELEMRGSVSVIGFEIYDYIGTPYPVQRLWLSGRDVRGKINVPKFFLNLGFEGEFFDEFSGVGIDVDHLGFMDLERVEDDNTDGGHRAGPADGCALP